MARAYYTHFPRTILWLVPGGTLEPSGAEPGESVEIDSFYLSKSPITNEQLEAFDPGFERSPLAPDDSDPALGVSFELARDYAAWYAEVSRKPMRLASAAEWTHAALGGDPASPWGEGAADEHLWHSGNSPDDRLPPLDGRRSNGYGLFGMLGGAWEWVVDGDGEGVLLGGSFEQPLEVITPWLRWPRETSTALPATTTFRIARGLRRG